ncbi:hypothetical protein SLEP1_g52062 [Rubroshorea leprosula]|uniref:FBD domain-containing protein n=1 Tax=Rubroshorea leprosula TaxID=152421 RepID=A0AAV5M550_9ROSI|nr:hypothetical protein SLEP1_g52062 [Rubroshorea leprosula]
MRQYLVLYAKYLDTSLGLVSPSKLSSKGIIKDDDDKHGEDGSDHQDLKERHQIYRLELRLIILNLEHTIELLINVSEMLSLVQILVANAQKLSVVRFEQINNGEAMSEVKDVTQLIPKIMKRKGNGDKWDNITYVENAFQKGQKNRLFDRYVVAEDT